MKRTSSVVRLFGKEKPKEANDTIVQNNRTKEKVPSPSINNLSTPTPKMNVRLGATKVANTNTFPENNKKSDVNSPPNLPTGGRGSLKIKLSSRSMTESPNNEASSLSQSQNQLSSTTYPENEKKSAKVPTNTITRKLKLKR